MKRFKGLLSFCLCVCFLLSFSVCSQAAGVQSDDYYGHFDVGDIPKDILDAYIANGGDPDHISYQYEDLRGVQYRSAVSANSYRVIILRREKNPSILTYDMTVGQSKYLGHDMNYVIMISYIFDDSYSFKPGDTWNVNMSIFHWHISVSPLRISGQLSDDEIYNFFNAKGGSYGGQDLDVSFVPDRSFTGPLFITFDNSNADNPYWTENVAVGFIDLQIDVSNSTDTILGKMGTFFSDLGNSIKEWFTQLKEWIKAIPDKITEMINKVGDWFNKVGDWFVELGNTIKEWFQNIIDSVGEWFSNLLQAIADWWQSVQDWFNNLITIPDGFADEYKSKWDAWLKAHLGFLYETGEITTGIFNKVKEAAVDKRHVITIPEIKIPKGDYVIMPETEFCFEDMINSAKGFQTAYTFYTVLVWGACCMGLFYLGRRKLNEVLTNRSGDE